ncbi:MAG TPA: flagellar filament capping protein FliD [Sphingomonas sp.]|nr:flagellar filament capping protein FliD [Sphingomonas sp.]
MTTTPTTGGTSSTTSNASLGQSIISTLNAGSGIDTATLITQLTAAQRSGLEDPITAKQTANTAQISAVASISSDLSAFSTSLNTLLDGGTLYTQPTSSDSSVMSVSAIAGYRLGNLASSITVNQLAQSQTLESQPTDTAAGYASGDTFTLTTTGGASVTLTAGTDFTDFSSLISAINAKTATTGVTASEVDDTNGAHLVLKGTSGAAQGFSIAANGSLAGFAYTPVDGDTASANTATGTGMQRLQVAQDAAFTMDGVSYTRSTNSFSDAIPGVKMTLTRTGAVTLGVSKPGDAITQAVNDFVSAYNQLRLELDNAMAAGTNGGTAGPLRGNGTIRDLERRLNQLTTTPLTASGAYRTLAEIGVKTNRDGSLSVDAAQLSNALTSHPDDVEALFNPTQSSNSPLVKINSTVGGVSAGSYSVSNIVQANSSTPASATINGITLTALVPGSNILTGAAGTPLAGLTLQILAGAPSSATLTIDQGLGGALQAVHDALLGSSGALTTLSDSLTKTQSSLSDAMDKAEAQVTVYHDRLVTQFSTMNTLVSGYKATQSYMTQQINLWTKSTN